MKVPAARQGEQRRYLELEALAFYRQEEEQGDNTAAAAAIGRYHSLVQAIGRAAAPSYWAQMQMNPGNALSDLGEREAGTARLEEAVMAFEACLSVVVTTWPEEWLRDVRSRREDASAEMARRASQ